MWQSVTVGVVVAAAVVYCIRYAMPSKVHLLLGRWRIFLGVGKICDQCSTCGACADQRQLNQANSLSTGVQPVRFHARPKSDM